MLTDLSIGMVKEARDRHRQGWVQDAARLAVRSRQFDAVLAHHMLYHLPDIPAALGAICRVLREDGCFFAATNGWDHMREVRELLANVASMIEDPGVDQELWSRPSGKTARTIARDECFTIAKNSGLFMARGPSAGG